MRGRKKTLKISEAEWHIMKVLWNGYEKYSCGMTLGDIIRDLPKSIGWSNTTIRTLIIRLAEKGAVSIDKTTGVYKYAPVSPKLESINTEVASFIDRVYDGSAVSLFDTMLKNGMLSDEDKKKIKSML